MRLNYFTRFLQHLCYVFFVLQFIIGVKLCQSQEYRIKESLQLLRSYQDPELKNAFKLIHFYDDQGRRSEIKDLKWSGENWQDFIDVTYVYNDDGQLIKCQITDYKDNETWHLSGIYNDNGRLAKVINSIKKPNPDSSFALLKFDQNGHLIEYRDEWNLSRFLYKYQSNGKFLNVTTEFIENNTEIRQNWLYIQNNGSNILEQKIRPNWAWGTTSYPPGWHYDSFSNHIHSNEVFDWYHEKIYAQHIYFEAPLAYFHNPIHDGKILHYSAEQIKSYILNNQLVDSWNWYERIYEYDDKNYLIQDRYALKDSMVWSDSTSAHDWETLIQNNYYYDSIGNCTTIVYQFWDYENKKWSDAAQYFYTYEKINNSKIFIDETKSKSQNKDNRFILTNSPNPFNQSTTIYFELIKPAVVTLQIYDIRGKKVRTLISQKELQKGEHRSVWNGKNDLGNLIASGIYFIRINIDQDQTIKRCLLLR
jgi:hypothetical protein